MGAVPRHRTKMIKVRIGTDYKNKTADWDCVAIVLIGTTAFTTEQPNI